MIDEIKITVKNLEEVYQHVHHAESLKFLEAGRVSFLERVGSSMESLISSGLYPVVRAINVQYLREVKAGEVLVKTSISEVTDRSVVFAQELFNERGKLAIEASVVCMFLNKELKRAVEVPLTFRDYSTK
jgi:acyl-CoA thioester hydrolase